jgi:hypothetical protein
MIGGVEKKPRSRPDSTSLCLLLPCINPSSSVEEPDEPETSRAVDETSRTYLGRMRASKSLRSWFFFWFFFRNAYGNGGRARIVLLCTLRFFLCSHDVDASLARFLSAHRQKRLRQNELPLGTQVCAVLPVPAR